MAAVAEDDLAGGLMMAEESMIELQLQEARLALQMSRDAAEALCMALGFDELDESFPEVMERDLLELQESELVRALENSMGKRAATAQANVDETHENITQYDAEFAQHLAGIPDGKWREVGNLLHGNIPASSQSAGPTCPVCMENIPQGSGLCAGGGSRVAPREGGPAARGPVGQAGRAAAGRAARGKRGAGGRDAGEVEEEEMEECGHMCCFECASTLVGHSVMDDGKVDIECAAVGCKVVFSEKNVTNLLADNDKGLERYHRLQAELLMGDRLVYCPELKCGQALEKPDETEANYPLATCPACSKMMCVTCKVVWHAGTSCKQYQRLPMHLKNPEDVALLGLAGKEGWRQCPRCENLIERNADGCTYIKCRCGCPFCYTCGKEYVHNKLTAENLHGKPNCKCGLWRPVAARGAADVAAGAAAGAAPEQGRDAEEDRLERARWKRLVKRHDTTGRWAKLPPKDEPCKWSDTLAECPRGRKCWNKHLDEIRWLLKNDQ